MSRPTPNSRAAYPHFEILATRWADNDIYGHMNNAIHYQLFDTAVNGFLLREGILAGPGAAKCRGDATTIFLVVSSSCDYFAELAFPQTIAAGLRIAHLGKSSIRYDIALFADDAETASAQGHFTHVNVHPQTRRPEPINQTARTILNRLQPV
ncbi:acyl-CoA thioesterase [Actibacterium sp. 188UL27-1]|uniref:acyl-CoA thioesterase n=1 Tax=Actibacterium sp. 188UL27-1 TaxID=2786961 RepID=UPI00351C6028